MSDTTAKKVRISGSDHNTKISRSKLWKDIKRDKYLYLLILPGLIVVAVFAYAPMYGLILAFKDYKPVLGITGSPWAGFSQFEKLFSRPESQYVIFNTIRISVMNLLISFPAPIILSLLLNELRNKYFKRSIQSVLYIPNFISWVVVNGLLYSFFSTTVGLVNKLIVESGGTAVNILSDPDKFLWVLYLSNVWKTAGWGTIIYMAAIAGVDVTQYEAADLDGANRFQKIIYITLPAIKFSIITMLILNIGGIMGANLDQILSLRSDATTAVSQVIDTYVYDMGVTKLRYDFSTAVGLFQQVINCVLLFTANWIVEKMGESSIFS